MSRLQRSYCVSVCLLAGMMPLQAADAALPAYVPPGARLIAGIRVRSLLDALAEQGVGKEEQEAISKMLAQTPLAGIDPFQDADEILLTAAGEGENPPSLVVMTGRFSAAAFSKGKPYRNALILENQPNSQQVTAFLDANTLLSGDLSLVRAAIDGSAKGAPIDPALVARAVELRAQYDIWGVGDPPASAEPWGSIDRLAFGMKLTHGLECFADVHARTPRDLDKLNSSLQPLEAMMKTAPAGGNEGSFDLRTADGAIHLSLSIPQKTLKKAVAAQRASLALAAAAHAAAATAPPKPKPSNKTEIVRDPGGNMVIVTLPGRE